MKKVLFTYPLDDEGANERALLLERQGFKIYYEKESDFQFKSYMKDIESLVCHNPFDRLDLDDFPSLKWIQLTSMGFEQVPVEKVAEHNIVVTNNRGGYSIPMGEWVVLNILELIKNRKQAYQNQIDKKWWMDFSVKEIYNKKIAFIGTGDIAKESAKRLQGFDVEIVGINTNGRSISGFDQCFPLDEIDDVLAQSDVAVICLPHTDQTHHLFDKARLETMKSDGYLINVSRGAIIKERDLIGHLEKGNLAGVALDVFEQEPLSEDSKLWKIDRVVITSHNSWISEMIDQRRWELIYENFKRFSKDQKLINVVEIARGY